MGKKIGKKSRGTIFEIQKRISRPRNGEIARCEDDEGTGKRRIRGGTSRMKTAKKTTGGHHADDAVRRGQRDDLTGICLPAQD